MTSSKSWRTKTNKAGARVANRARSASIQPTTWRTYRHKESEREGVSAANSKQPRTLHIAIASVFFTQSTKHHIPPENNSNERSSIAWICIFYPLLCPPQATNTFSEWSIHTTIFTTHTNKHTHPQIDANIECVYKLYLYLDCNNYCAWDSETFV